MLIICLRSFISPMFQRSPSSWCPMTMLRRRKAPKKSSALDPVPVSLLTSCLPELLPIIVKIINGSLCSSSVSSSLKDALITPILKKPSLDPEDLKNFGPVSKLPYISKIVEREMPNLPILS